MAMSHELIHQFKISHQSILEVMGEINRSIRSYPKVKPQLRDLHTKLLAHLGKQDDRLLASLAQFFSADREAGKMIEFLQVDLKDTKIKALIFFDNHSGEMDDIRARNFPRHFTEFSAVMTGRIKLEEDYLFPLLAKIPPS